MIPILALGLIQPPVDAVSHPRLSRSSRISRDGISSLMAILSAMKVRVAGQPFEFKRDTVRGVASHGSLLRDLVDGNFGAPQGTTPFLDRDPGMFQHVLQWHRNQGQLPAMMCMDRCTLEDLRFEAGFYSEPKLGEQITAELGRRDERAAGRWVSDPVIRRVERS